MLYRYMRCGHIGRQALLASGWIRVAEIRPPKAIIELPGNCPHCTHGIP